MSVSACEREECSVGTVSGKSQLDSRGCARRECKVGWTEEQHSAPMALLTAKSALGLEKEWRTNGSRRNDVDSNGELNSQKRDILTWTTTGCNVGQNGHRGPLRMGGRGIGTGFVCVVKLRRAGVLETGEKGRRARWELGVWRPKREAGAKPLRMADGGVCAEILLAGGGPRARPRCLLSSCGWTILAGCGRAYSPRSVLNGVQEQHATELKYKGVA